MWAIQSDAGNLEYRTGSWNNLSYTLSEGTEYHFNVIANRSGSDINNYDGSNSVANGTMDLWIDSGSGFALVGDDVSLTNNQDAAAFQICQINGGTSVEFDNIYIDNTVVPPFTPTAVSLANFSVRYQTTNLAIVMAVSLLLVGSLYFLHRRKAV